MIFTNLPRISYPCFPHSFPCQKWTPSDNKKNEISSAYVHSDMKIKPQIWQRNIWTRMSVIKQAPAPWWLRSTKWSRRELIKGKMEFGKDANLMCDYIGGNKCERINWHEATCVLCLDVDLIEDGRNFRSDLVLNIAPIDSNIFVLFLRLALFPSLQIHLSYIILPFNYIVNFNLVIAQYALSLCELNKLMLIFHYFFRYFPFTIYYLSIYITILIILEKIKTKFVLCILCCR